MLEGIAGRALTTVGMLFELQIAEKMGVRAVSSSSFVSSLIDQGAFPVLNGRLALGKRILRDPLAASDSVFGLLIMT